MRPTGTLLTYAFMADRQCLTIQLRVYAEHVWCVSNNESCKKPMFDWKCCEKLQPDHALHQPPRKPKQLHHVGNNLSNAVMFR